jgi:hypothetical protein
MTIWYKTDPTRFNYRELWRLSGRGLLPFARAVYRKWFKIRSPAKFGHQFRATLDLLELQALPERPRKVLGAIIVQAERHGFRFVFCHRALAIGDIAVCSAVLMSADGQTLANAIWVRTGRREEASFVLGSRTESRLLLTGNHPHLFDTPPEFDVWHLPGKSVAELVAIHAERLDRLGRERVLPATEADVATRIIENQQRTLSFQLARGVHVPMTPEEVERLSGVVTATLVAESGNPFQAPREDQPEPIDMPSAAPNSNLRTSMMGGFAGGVFFGEVLGLVSLRDALRQGLTTWELVFGFFILFPALLGAAGASLGFASWFLSRVFRRFVA